MYSNGTLLVLYPIGEVPINAFNSVRFSFGVLPCSIGSLLFRLLLTQQALQPADSTFDLILVHLESISIEGFHHMLRIDNFTFLRSGKSGSRFPISQQPSFLEFVI